MEYLVEVKNTACGAVPKDWLKISSTKAVSRFHSPDLITMVGGTALLAHISRMHHQLDKLSVARERLKMAAHKAWLAYLARFGLKYDEMRCECSCLDLSLLSRQATLCATSPPSTVCSRWPPWHPTAATFVQSLVCPFVRACRVQPVKHAQIRPSLGYASKTGAILSSMHC